MITKGIRILDEFNGAVSVKLQDIFEEIHDGDLLHWSILFFDGMGHLKDGKSIPDFEKEAVESDRGIFMKWDELNAFADTIDQLFSISIIASKDFRKILRYHDKKTMYEACDIVIRMIDSSFWEVFSKDESLIHRLIAKFKDIEYLT